MTEPTPRALVLLADGAEEMEAVIVVDVLRRAEIEVVLAGVEGPQAVTCSRSLVLLPDTALGRVTGDFDVVVLPGGALGSQKLGESAAVGQWLRSQEQSGRLIAAICAAPDALVTHGVCAGRRLTSHPAVRERVAGHGQYAEDRVVVDGPLVTSRGPGTAFEFALQLVAMLTSEERAASLRGPMLLR